jgi:hypothetical protein
MSWLYAAGSDVYFRILKFLMFIPYKYPFFDLEAIPAWILCREKHGFDVYTSMSWVSCGLAPIIYSPLWLRLTFLPTDPTWTNWLGLPLLAVFLLSLGVLPLSRRLDDRILTVLATFSSLPVFAMERGNVDLIIFLLAVVAAFCLAGTLLRRILGYAVLVLGGLLKFYPLVLLVLMLRERLAVFMGLSCVAVAVVATTAIALLDELRRITPIPSGRPFFDMWGAKNLPTGFSTVLKGFLEVAKLSTLTVESISGSPWMPAFVASVLLTAALTMAFRLTRRVDFRACVEAIPDRSHQFLLIGGLLVVGCFFAGQNIGYRGVFLLLILPGLLALTHASPGLAMRNVFALTAGAVLCVAWELTTRLVAVILFGGMAYPASGSVAVLTVWLLQELAWWWLITVLMAILFRFVTASSAWHDLHTLLSRGKSRGAVAFAVPHPADRGPEVGARQRDEACSEKA